MQKIILFYRFTPLVDPEAIRLWQRNISEQLNLRGRIIISSQGINGTLGGEVNQLKTYIKSTKSYPGFKSTVFKWSPGERQNFPKLSIKVRTETVTFGVNEELKVNQTGVIGGGKRLNPDEVHQLVKKRGDEVVFFDGRNAYEAAVGKFKNAVIPVIEHSRDFAEELKDKKYDPIRNKAVITYCTGGIRCEVLTVLMKNRGFKEVYQLDGGIITYGQKYGDNGLWEGSLYMFDGRMSTQFSNKARHIAQCLYCNAKTSNYINCALKACNKLILVCKNCKQQTVCQECQANQLA
ncbi:MAG TPA: rhodanese-related sulfurtransferase [Candidatus Dormibacteraeota bacterium]|nr:rhodanese-related sulfurtransferase [Candidatus Dormibacteraeota bacterium]